jgi:predicted outer membrane repeat protein
LTPPVINAIFGFWVRKQPCHSAKCFLKRYITSDTSTEHFETRQPEGGCKFFAFYNGECQSKGSQVLGSELWVEDTEFESNHAALGGGGISAVFSILHSFTRNTFVRNQAGIGQSKSGKAKAMGDGGGLFFVATTAGYTSSEVLLSDLIFVNNSAGFMGGGLCVKTLPNSVASRTSGDTFVVQVENATVTGNGAGRLGGGIGISLGNGFGVEDLDVLNFKVEIGGSRVYDNNATQGGGIQIAQGHCLMRDTGVKGNRAETDGGGIFVGSMKPSTTKEMNVNMHLLR